MAAKSMSETQVEPPWNSGNFTLSPRPSTAGMLAMSMATVIVRTTMAPAAIASDVLEGRLRTTATPVG